MDLSIFDLVCIHEYWGLWWTFQEFVDTDNYVMFFLMK